MVNSTPLGGVRSTGWQYPTFSRICRPWSFAFQPTPTIFSRFEYPCVTPVTMFWIRDRVVPHCDRVALSTVVDSGIVQTIAPSSLLTLMQGCQS